MEPSREYRFNKVRLESFKNWPGLKDPEELAAVGFYYLGYSDRVKCFACHWEIYNWQETDNPWTEHQRFNKKRPLLNGISCNNVPIEPSFDVCGIYEIDCNTSKCKICNVNKINVIFLPCQHAVSCNKCYKKLFECITCHKCMLS